MVWNMSAVLLEQGLSVPRATVISALSRLGTGLIPEPSFRLEMGLWEILTLFCFRMCMSFWLRATQWAAMTSLWRTPSFWRYSTTPPLTGILKAFSILFGSSWVSATWMCHIIGALVPYFLLSWVVISLSSFM